METSKENIVEKRVKATVIRRRARPVAPPVEAAPVGETPPPPASPATDLLAEIPPSPAKPLEIPVTIGAGPEGEEKGEKVSRVRKVTRRKTRDELLMEEYERVGGLKQVARLAEGEEEESEPAVEHLSRIFEPERQARRKRVIGKKEFKKPVVTTPAAKKRKIKIRDTITVTGLSKAMGVKATAVVQKIAELGSTVGIQQSIDDDTAVLVAHEFGYEVENVAFKEEQVIPADRSMQELSGSKTGRAPVVTVMGHVDHGKTSLLDYVRKSKIAEGEAGGITQHIGAYAVQIPKGKITFIDTPGHEAFTAMRARGAQVTDIVILVVAADDGVKPQTIEAINHARSAHVPIVVAINKIDKPGTDSERVKRALAEQGLVSEDWGGETIMVPVSAKTGAGIATLLEMVLLQAEMLELKANPNVLAQGVVLETKLEKGRGPVATVIVQEGTLKQGDALVAGPWGGKVRALLNSAGKTVKEAGPSVPVEILGLAGLPEAGDRFDVLASEEDVKKVTEYRQQQEQKEKLGEAPAAATDLETLYQSAQAGESAQLNVVVKGDVQGSVEALADAITGLATDQVKVGIVHQGVGGITESDVMLAEVSRALIIGFNVRPDSQAKRAAEVSGVTVRLYRVIYEILDDLRKAMTGLLEPIREEEYLGRAEVRDLFKISKVGTIAGTSVTDGKILRGAYVRLLRDQTVVYEGRISSLKRFKEDTKEVPQGYECGIGIENFNDVKVGDVIEVYRIKEVAATL